MISVTLRDWSRPRLVRISRESRPGDETRVDLDIEIGAWYVCVI